MPALGLLIHIPHIRSNFSFFSVMVSEILFREVQKTKKDARVRACHTNYSEPERQGLFTKRVAVTDDLVCECVKSTKFKPDFLRRRGTSGLATEGCAA